MPLFSVTRRGQPAVTLEAPNWIVAMGNGIQALTGDTSIDRLACEMLPNGTVIARDVQTGAGYVIQPIAEPAAEELEDTVDDVLDASLDEPEGQAPAGGSLREGLSSIQAAASAVGAWEKALEVALSMVPSHAGTAVEATPRAGLLFVAVQGPNASGLHSLRLPYGKGFVGFSIQRGATLTVSDVQADARHYAAVDDTTGFVTEAILCVPVLDGDTAFGCIELLNPRQGSRFSAAQVRTVQRIARALSERLVRSGVFGRAIQREG